MKGQQLIDFIKNNHLEDAVVTVTATIYRQGDHDCITTKDISVSESAEYDRDLHKSLPSINIYVDDNLY